MGNASQILEFMKIVEKLCFIKRDNFLSEGGNEKDSDHIMKLCFLIMTVYPYLKTKVDYTKMLEMALIHDLVEVMSGDYSLSATTSNPELKAQKKAKEKEAIEHYRKILPAPLNDKIYDLFMEYENKTSREAKIVWVLDKLDAHYQANLYNDGSIHYWGDCPNGHVYYEMAAGKIPTSETKTILDLEENVLQELEDIIIKISRENMDKCKIKV